MASIIIGIGINRFIQGNYENPSPPVEEITDAILTEDGLHYIMTEDEQFYLQLEEEEV